MPQYQVTLDGKTFVLEGDHPPSEDEARAAIQAHSGDAPPATPPAGPPRTALDTAKDVGIGALKGAAHTALDLGGAVEAIPGVGRITNALGNAAGGAIGKLLYGTAANPVSNDTAQTAARQDTAYRNTPQKVGGALETVAELAAPVGAAESVVPRAGRAMQKFDTVMAAAKDVPVNMNAPGDVALRIQQLAERGGTMPRAVSQLLRRVTDPAQADLTYGEGRDFASNISRLSADDYNRLTPVIRREVGSLRSSLNGALGDAAATVGKGEDYASAMQEYAQAARLKALVEALGAGAKKALPYAATGGAAGLGYAAASKLKGLLGGE